MDVPVPVLVPVGSPGPLPVPVLVCEEVLVLVVVGKLGPLPVDVEVDVLVVVPLTGPLPVPVLVAVDVPLGPGALPIGPAWALFNDEVRMIPAKLSVVRMFLIGFMMFAPWVLFLQPQTYSELINSNRHAKS